MRSLELSVALSSLADLTYEFPVQRIAQYVTRAVTVAHVKVTIRSKSNIGRHEVNRPLAIARVFPRITMNPDFFPGKGGFHDSASIDIAMVQKLCFAFAPQLQTMGSSPKALTESTDELASYIEDNNRLAAHA